MDLTPESSCQATRWRDSARIEQDGDLAAELADEDSSGEDWDAEAAREAGIDGAARQVPRQHSRLPARANADELAALIAQVMRQDEAALSALYASMSGQVYSVALQVTRRVDVAEEVLQDTFWQIWRQAPRFDPARGTAVGWILTIARSRALDAVRSFGRDPLRALRSISVDGIEVVGEFSADPLDLLHDVRRDSLLHSALAALDPLKRQLIALAFYRGLTQEEIATQTGLPLGTVKSHLRRTLASLRQALGNDMGLEDLGRAA